MADLFWPGDERAATAFDQGSFLETMVELEEVWFHALQSAIAFGGLSVAWMIALSLGPPGWILAIFVIPPVSAVLWLVLMYKAYQGERFKVPIVGDMADQRV